jgi:tRNA(Ile2) C34 agmatinyltransferase TiaS
MHCPMCASSELNRLGSLGYLEWFRCRACGMDVSHKAKGDSLKRKLALARIALTKARNEGVQDNGR